MQMLDMRTLSMVNAIGAVTVALLTTFLWRFVSREWGMRQWVFGSLALAAGSVLLLLRDAARRTGLALRWAMACVCWALAIWRWPRGASAG